MSASTANWENCLEHAAASDVGLRRANNQDNMAVVIADSRETFRQRGHLFVVADGMGAHAAGELASKIATDVVPLTYHKLRDLSPPEALHRAVLDANEQIHSRGEASPEFKGMGTTCSVLALLPQGALLAHVGDSRAYRLRGNRFDQLTFDHSLAWEIRAAAELSDEDLPSYFPRNIITRSLGPNSRVEVDLEGPLAVQPGDTFLLCSDGLSGPLEDEEMGAIVGCLPPNEAVQALVNLANLRGGPDNITVVVARVTGPLDTGKAEAGHERAKESAGPRPVAPLTWTSLGVAVLAALGAAAMAYWIAALVCVVGALAAAAVALSQRYAQREASTDFGHQPLGKGPYTSCECGPNTKLVNDLAQIVSELRRAATHGDWTVDWHSFNSFAAKAEEARAAKRHTEAIRDYAHGISFMMDQLKHQRRSQGTDKHHDSGSEGVLE